MTKTHTDPIVAANTALSMARDALTSALEQRDRAHALVRLRERDVSHEEDACGLAEDRVLVGDQDDTLREAALLQQARAALDSATQGAKRAESLIAEAEAAVARTERGVLFAEADSALAASLGALPALEDAVATLAKTYHAVLTPYGTAQSVIRRLHPGSATGMPTLNLLNYLGAALSREGIQIETFSGPSHTDATFELGAPVRAVCGNLSGMVDRLRAQAA